MKTALHSKGIISEEQAATPLGAEEFAALMENIGPSPPSGRLAAAVSGGPDSMALAFCAKRLVGGDRVLALIVDHGLRGESRAEAEQTQQVLAAAGIESEILRWEHAPVVSRLHEAARKARYRLLIEACKRRGISHLMFAHHREDQAETILMRFAKGSGIDGLAGMSSKSTVEGVCIVRPFLGVSKERLMATCAANNISFVIDPSNRSEKFARGRLRRVMPLLAAEGLTVESLAGLGVRAAEAKEALDHAADMLLRVATRLDDAGVIHIGLEHLRTASRAIARRAIVACLQTIHPEDHAPEYAALTRLLDALCADAEMPSATLQGCLIGKNETCATIMREYAAIPGALPIMPGESVVWDYRWRVVMPAGSKENFVLRALGNPPHEVLDHLAPGLRRKIPQGRVRATLPSLWLDGALAIIPDLPGSSGAGAVYAELTAEWPPVTRYG